MSVELGPLRDFGAQLAALKSEMPAIMETLIIGEGVFAVGQARRICRDDAPDIISSGDYMRNFHAGDSAVTDPPPGEHDGSPPRRSGMTYRIDVYNNLRYAKPLEYGFRSHFVPGHWEGHSFVYRQNDPAGGMYVGPYKGYVPGRFTLRRAVRRTKETQDARLGRKLDAALKLRLG